MRRLITMCVRCLCLAAAIALLGCRPGDSGADAARVSAPGEYAGYSERLYTERVLESRYVEVRDGTKLAVDIFRPSVDGKAVEGRFPVVWIHTPYRRAQITGDGERVSILARGDSAFL